MRNGSACPFENVRIISPYIGGGFGSKGLPLPHGAIAAMAAKMLARPVKIAVTRPQTFAAIGGRPETRQTLALGATKEGKLISIVHRGVNETSMNGVWVEPLGSVTSIMYATPNFCSRQNVVRGQYRYARRVACAGREPERIRHRMRDRRARL